MKVKIKQLGGFAGVDQTLAQLDSSQLRKDSSDKVRKQLESLSALAAQQKEPVGADQFRYEVEITEPGAAPRTISFIDDGDPGHPLMQQIAALIELAKE